VHISQDDFAQFIGPVARKLLGDPNARLSSKTELRFGTNGSKSIDLEKGRWYDHEAKAGGNVLELIEHCNAAKNGEAIEWMRNAGILPNSPARKIVAKYDYVDELGDLLSQVVRFAPKDFRQRRPDKSQSDGWSWNVKGVRRVPYRLPDLIEAIAQDRTVMITEGEKDCDRLNALGIPSTTNAGGAGKWHPELREHLRGANVVIVPDNDEAGRDHAESVAQALFGVAARIRVLNLVQHWASCPPKGDISDWFDQDGTPEKLWHLVDKLADWAPSTKTNHGSDLISSFTFLGDAPPAPPRQLIKNLFPAEGVAVTGGQSGAGKTFIEIHKAVCLSKALPFFGHKIVEQVGTAFVAAEGRGLIPNRFAAALAAKEITDKLPIAWIKQLPDFSSAEGIKLFVRQLKALDERFRGDFGMRLGQITIDTVAASFSMNDEDDNSEATKVCNAMRRIGDEVGALMCPVHHFGKNPESGLRGASAWKGSADVVVGVLAEIDSLSGRASDREFVCTKARDGEQGPISPFELEFVRLGLDPDGDVYGSCCVVPSEGQSRFERTAKLSKGARAVQDAISDALDSCGMLITPRAGMPSVKAAKVADIRREFDRRYVVDEADPAKAANAKRMAFKRALDGLPPSQFGAGSAEGADWVWRIKD
jgi:hypothetical protein